MQTKKELKDGYKFKKFRIGAFQIRNTVNEKIYVDGSVNLEAIWNRNKMELNYGSFRNALLQKEWNEFGESNFKFEILSEVEQKEDKTDYNSELKELTAFFISELKPFAERGYNKA